MTTCTNCSHQTAEDFTFCPKCGTKQAAPAPEGSDPLIGRTLGDKYRVLSELGEGSMGKVYLGEHISLKKKIALKVLHTDVKSGQEARTRFQREGIAAGQFTHPNAIQIFDFDVADGEIFYLAMEYVEGVDLKRLIRDRGALSVDQAIDAMCQILGALAEAHLHGIIHRDLKPENVMVVRSASGGAIQTVKVLDFGLSKLVDRPLEASLTEIGRVMGTPLYMSPEQVSGDTLDHRTDLYSAGLILYEMLSGKTPFTGKTLQEILAKHLNELPPSVVQSNPDLRVPVDLDEFLRKALEKDRGKRFQTADSMLAALKEVRLDGALAKPAPRPVPAAEAARARSRMSLVIGGVVAVGVLAVAGLMFSGAMGGESGASTGPPPPRIRSKAGPHTPAESSYLAQLDSVRADLLAGNTPAAFAGVAEALRSEVADAEGYYVRGLVYREQNDDDTARVDFEEALSLDPSYGDAAAQLGWMALDVGDAEGALERFLEASKIDAGSADAVAGQGAVRLLEGRAEDAERLLRQALAIDSELVAAHLYMGRACLELGRNQDAVEAFVHAKRNAPGSWEAYAGLGEAYLALDRWQDAKLQLIAAIDLEPDAAEPRLYFARMLVDREQFREAVDQLTTAVERSPEDPRLQVLLGITLAETFAEGAVNALKKAVELGAGSAQVRTLLGGLYLEAGQPEEALVQLDEALAADDANAAAHLDRGLALIQLGRYDEAATPLERAAELSPSDPYPHLALGALYMEFLGNSQKASEHLRKYGELGGEDPRAAQWLRQRVR